MRPQRELGLIHEECLPKIRSMATGKFGVNLAFACIVSVLAVTAAIGFYGNSHTPAVSGNAATQSGGRLPKDHPDIDVAQRIAALGAKIAQDPNNVEYQTQIANLYYDSRQYEKAIEHYRRSLKLRPEDPNVETDLAVSLHYAGRDDEALEALNRVLSYSPGFSQALFNKGIILINAKKDVNTAIRLWEELLRRDPDFAREAELEQRIKILKESIR